MSARSFTLNKRRQGNITIERDSLSLNCVLHKTTVCKITGNQVQLQSGGWQTITTKTAINRFLFLNGFNYGIVQIKGIWFIEHGTSLKPYVDGMILIRG